MSTPAGSVLQVFLGTKAQYIKTAPLLRLMDEQGVAYRLVDSGQHGALSVGLRDELGVRAPDHVLGNGQDVNSIPQAVVWALRILWLLVRPRQLREVVFAGAGPAGICVVHGDTPSTLLATLLARRVGLRVAHLEAGLTSRRLFDPFPEEAIRRVVMRLSSLLFAPDQDAVAHLEALRLRGEVVAVDANTVVEAAVHALDGGSGPGVDAPAVVTMHRVENLRSAKRVADFVDLVCAAAQAWPVTFVVHGPTRPVLERGGHVERLQRAGVDLLPLQPHGDFVHMLDRAPWVITDGGSIQEECALLGVPTLLWRRRSERPDGIGANVVVSGHDRRIVEAFLAQPQSHRRARALADVQPSAQVLAVLLERLGV